MSEAGVVDGTPGPQPDVANVDAAPVLDARAPEGGTDPDAGDLDAQRPGDATSADALSSDVAQTADAAVGGPCLAGVVRVGEVEVFAYEASRPDADGENPGVDETRACSVPGAVPWTGMTLDVATAACAASGFAVCDAETWYRVCAGPEERDFPYGDAYVNARCNDHISGGGALEPTGSRPQCRTPEGIYDLSGNVWEFVAESERRGASWKVGAVTFRLDAAKCHATYVVPANFWGVDLGFRCCRPVP